MTVYFEHFLQGTLHVDGWRATLNSIVKNLAVAYPLVVFFLNTATSQ